MRSLRYRYAPELLTITDWAGFIAVAFVTKSIAIIDMRGPDIILREGFDEEGLAVKKKRKKGNSQNVVGENSLVGAMKWVVSGLGPGSLFTCLFRSPV